MTVFDDMNRDIFADTDLTIDAVYNRQTIKVIFDSSFIVVNGVATRSITAEVLEADTADMERGQKLIITEVEYTIADMHPTGEGTTILVLSRDAVGNG